MLLAEEKINEFWKDALEQTKGLQQAALLKNRFDCQQSGERWVLDIISQLCQSEELNSSIGPRLYVEGTQSEQENLSVFDSPTKGESLKNWSASNFNNKRFCLVINLASRCSNSYSVAVAKLFHPFMPRLADLNYPFPFISADFFLGDYEHTPFGIHMDKAESISVLHIHLGPGPKIMTIWPASHPDFAGAKIIHDDIEKHLKTGKTYTIESGDAFFLPAGSHYHIGKSPSLSLGLTMNICSSTNNKRKAIKKLLKNRKKSVKPLSPQELQLELQEVIHNQEFQRLSNNYLPICFKAKIQFPKILKGMIKRTIPFKIHLRETDDLGASLIYARGHQLKSKASTTALQLIKEINNDQKIDIESWLNSHVDPREKSAQELLIRELLEVHAITFV